MKRKAQSWIDELNNYLEDYKKDTVQLRVVGNKIDLVDEETLQNWNDAELVSAKTGEGIDELFLKIGKDIPIDKFTLLQEDVPQSTSTSNEGGGINLEQSPEAVSTGNCSC